MKNEDIGFLIKQISDRIKARIDAGMKSSDLTYSQFHVLAYIAHNNRSVTQKDLEDFLGVSHPTVVGLVTRLSAKGFVETATDKSDRRVKRISMTDKALRLGECMQLEHEKSEEKLQAGLSEEEVSELKRMLKVVYSNLSDEN